MMGECFINLPEIIEFVDEKWIYERKNDLLSYLQENGHGITLASYPKNKCLLCNELHPVPRWHWDGAWIWPAVLHHYVDKHSIRLPDRMILHIEQQNFIPPRIHGLPDLNHPPWPQIEYKKTAIDKVADLIRKIKEK
jgi:hypothetical protein